MDNPVDCIDAGTAQPGSVQADAPEVSPLSALGLETDRDAAGRFRRGNQAALVVGATSAAFWRAHDAARQAIVTAILTDAGYTVDDAPCALQLAAEGIAQAGLMRDAAFRRVVESGGPMTSAGRTRRAYAVWLSASDRLERHLRLVGLRRLPRRLAGSLEDCLAEDGRP